MDGSIWDQAPFVPSGAPVVTVTISAGTGDGQSIKLRRAVSLFGTKRGCKLLLRHPTVARRHCVIVNTGQHVILRDLDTHGRTLRNGVKIRQEYVKDADRIDVGPWEFRLSVAKVDHAGTSDSPIIVDLEPDPTVLAIEDSTAGEVTKLESAVSILGRGSGADIVIGDREVSSVHAMIFTYLHKPAIFDLASENGTSVNGEPAGFAMLADGDEISLGGHTLRFRCNAPSTCASANGKGDPVLKPMPFPNPEGTLSDLIDFSAESML